MLAGCVRSCMEWIPLKWSGVPQPQPIGLATWVLLSVTRTDSGGFCVFGGAFLGPPADRHRDSGDARPTAAETPRSFDP